jgi:hypothetical protein
MTTYRPQLSDEALPLTHQIEVIDEKGRIQQIDIPGERPLTIYVDKKEVVTLMTLGGAPEALTLGYLRNQRLVKDITDIRSIQVDWETDSVAVQTHVLPEAILQRTEKKTVTSGCGQGTMFGDFMSELDQLELPEDIYLSQEHIEKVIDDENDETCLKFRLLEKLEFTKNLEDVVLVQRIKELFGTNVLYHENETEIVNICLQNHKNYEYILKQMQWVSQNHTYVNRVNDLLELISKNGDSLEKIKKYN